MGGHAEWRTHTSDTDLVDELLQPGGPRTRSFVPNPFRGRYGIGNLLVVLGALTGLLALAYVVDMVASAGEVPRGVTVAGVAIGGLNAKDAETTLRRELGSRAEEPIEVRAGETTVPLDPRRAGLAVNWAATVQSAGQQPWKPWARLESLFADREVPLVTVVDEQAVRTALRDLAERSVNRDAIDGGIGFRPATTGGTEDQGAARPIAVEPRPGALVSGVDSAVEAVRQRWPLADHIDLPVRPLAPKLSSEAVHATLDGLVRPLLRAPIVLRGDGGGSVLLPEDIAKALEFTVRAQPGEGNRLEARLNDAVLRTVVSGELQATEQQPKSAELLFRGGVPVVSPSVRGTRIDWPQTFADLARQVSAQPDRRVIPVFYDAVEPEVSTDDIRALGVREIIGEAAAAEQVPEAIRNLRTAAGAVHGVVVRPGETFSLTQHTGPHTASRGYVPAPRQADGTGPTVIGGGAERLAATLTAAARRAGLPLVEHTTRGEVEFTNHSNTAVALQAGVTSHEVRVTLWGSAAR